jgi:uncharacterized protein (TIGR03000 family)
MPLRRFWTGALALAAAATFVLPAVSAPRPAAPRPAAPRPAARPVPNVPRPIARPLPPPVSPRPSNWGGRSLNYGGYRYGYPGWGYGYPGWGYGYPGWGYGSGISLSFGYGNPYGYYGSGYGYPGYYAAPTRTVVVPIVQQQPSVYVVPAAATLPVPATANPSAYLSVTVPTPDAEVLIDGRRLDAKTGTVRDFVSPPLEPGYRYSYEVTARWNEGDQPVERTQTVEVRPGDHASVAFTTP